MKDNITETISERDQNIEEILELSDHSINCPHCQRMIDLTGLAKKVSYTCGSNEFARKAFKRFCVDENQTNTITLVELASLKSNIVDHQIETNNKQSFIKIICKTDKQPLKIYRLSGDLSYYELAEDGSIEIQTFQGRQTRKAIKKAITLPTTDYQELRNQYDRFVVFNDIKCKPQHYKIYYDIETFNQDQSMQFPQVNSPNSAISTICAKVYHFDGQIDEFVEDINMCISSLKMTKIDFERYAFWHDMADTFINRLLEYQAKLPVILIGYNSNSDMNGDANNVIYSDNKVPIVGYDLPMIWVQSRHSLKLGVRKFKISAERTISVINRIKRTNIICLDLYAYVHRENLSNEAFKHNTDKKLNTVLRSLKLPEKHEISEKDLFQSQLGKIDANKMLEYCQQDVAVLHGIIEKIQFNQTIVEYMSTYYATIEQAIYGSAGSLLNKSVMEICRNEKLEMLPIIDSQFNDKKVSGAYVRNPQSNIYRQLINLDFSSLYPSIIVGFNTFSDQLISYDLVDTVDLRQKYSDTDLNNNKPKELMDKFEFSTYKTFDKVGSNMIVYCSFCDKNDSFIYYIYKAIFNLDTQSLMAKKLIDLKTQRNQCVSERDKYQKGEFKYNYFDVKQKLIKISMNSIYGSTAIPQIYRYGHQIVASAITAIGRRQAYIIGKRLEEDQLGLIRYGDTDSLYLEPFNTNYTPEQYESRANEYVQQYLQYGDDKIRKFTKLALEEVVSPVFFEQQEEKLYRHRTQIEKWLNSNNQ